MTNLPPPFRRTQQQPAPQYLPTSIEKDEDHEHETEETGIEEEADIDEEPEREEDQSEQHEPEPVTAEPTTPEENDVSEATPEAHEARENISHTNPIEEADLPHLPCPVPPVLHKNDLVITVMIHHNERDPRGPLVTITGKRLPADKMLVKGYHAIELTNEQFLDNVQHGLATIMQELAQEWSAEEQRRAEDKQKQEQRQRNSAQATQKTKTQASIGHTEPAVPARASSTPTQKETPAPAPSTPQPTSTTTSNKSEEYRAPSLFD